MGKIIIFDAYGTLFKLDTDNAVLDGILGSSKEEFLALWRQKLLEYSWLVSLADEWEEFNSIVLKAIQHSCDVFNVNVDRVNAILMDIYEHPLLFNDAKKVFLTLDATMCIMSNGEPETLKNAVAKNNIDQYIDKVFSASHVKNYKVSPQVYRMATSHYNIGPTNMYFVSSNAWDIIGASYFGYKTVWVNRDGKVFDNLVDKPDFEIKSLEELKRIVSLG